MATENGSAMWQWATQIRFLGGTPTPGALPYIYVETTSELNDNFTDPAVLQETLLVVDYFTLEDGSRCSEREIMPMLLMCLKGACIQCAERNVEMLLSTYGPGRFDFSPGKSPKSLPHRV